MLASLILSAALLGASPAPSQTPAVPCDGKCLAGVSIGEDKYKALAPFGSQPMPGVDTRILGDFESYSGFMIGVYYENTVVAISLSAMNTGPLPTTSDPYGIRLGDSADHLTSVRGQPDAIDGDEWRYGQLDGLHWIYTLQGGVVNEMMVSSVPSVS